MSHASNLAPVRIQRLEAQVQDGTTSSRSSQPTSIIVYLTMAEFFANIFPMETSIVLILPGTCPHYDLEYPRKHARAYRLTTEHVE
jgi:hypothetical protein